MCSVQRSKLSSFVFRGSLWLQQIYSFSEGIHFPEDSTSRGLHFQKDKLLDKSGSSSWSKSGLWLDGLISGAVVSVWCVTFSSCMLLHNGGRVAQLPSPLGDSRNITLGCLVCVLESKNLTTALSMLFGFKVCAWVLWWWRRFDSRQGFLVCLCNCCRDAFCW